MMEETSNLQQPEATKPQPRDAENWADPVSMLDVPDVPSDAINLNVRGRRVTGPVQGFGQLWQKTYKVRLSGAAVTPEQVIKTWKENFQSFWPPNNRFYGSLTGIAPGEVALLNLGMPGGVKLSTGILVLYADDVSFAFMTPQGHIFSSWITFSAQEEDGATAAQVQVLMRASDPIYELGFIFGALKMEDKFWTSTLESLARHFGVAGHVTLQAICIDQRRQWANAKNAWHNAFIRSTLYQISLPPRIAYRSVRARAAARTARRG
jgi:hypothetical protein